MKAWIGKRWQKIEKSGEEFVLWQNGLKSLEKKIIKKKLIIFKIIIVYILYFMNNNNRL